MVWYSYLFKNFPKFVVIYTVKGFSVVSEAEVDFFFFLEFSCFFYDPKNVGNFISGKSLDFFFFNEIISSIHSGKNYVSLDINYRKINTIISTNI